jgi:Family of unknown function (DUF6152)
MIYRRVGWAVAALLMAAPFSSLIVSAPAFAHHSFAMFDQKNGVEMEGVVREFRYVSPHSFIILEVKQEDGTVESWTLEGVSPSALAREGWSRASIKTGDELKVWVAPLRSGAPGGAWVTQKIHFRDGRPIVEPQEPVKAP